MGLGEWGEQEARKTWERKGVCERFKMILEGEERMRENMNRKDENARESLSRFEIAFFAGLL